VEERNWMVEIPRAPLRTWVRTWKIENQVTKRPDPSPSNYEVEFPSPSPSNPPNFTKIPLEHIPRVINKS